MDKLKLRTLIRSTIRVLKVQDGDVILLKIHTEGINDKKAVNSFANAIRAGGRPKCVLIALDDFAELDVLNEEDMEKHGWVRKVKE
jgi:hypothetical protein